MDVEIVNSFLVHSACCKQHFFRKEGTFIKHKLIYCHGINLPQIEEQKSVQKA